MKTIPPISILLIAVSALLAECCAATPPTPLGKRILEPFDFQGITLDDGPMLTQVRGVLDRYLQIPDDDLLKGFRRRAGKPAPGNDLGGWYSSDTFHVFGQIVSGLARLHAATGDPAARDKVNLLIKEWGSCIEPDGYFFYSRKPNAPHYIYDKMLWGLLDAHLYCANPEALGHLSRITDWAIKHLDRKRQLGNTATEWYTLSENLYRAYLITGDAKYGDFAQVWEYPEYWDIYARNTNIFAPRPDGRQTPGYHAYSHVNTLGGAGAAYLVTGAPRYLDILKNAYNFLQSHEVYATGGYGPNERLLPHPQLLDGLYCTSATFETQCGSWAAFKMSKYLMSFTGDARYGDWVERLLYNGVGASLPMTADGRVFYYANYQVAGAEKHNTDGAWRWSCCTGTRPQVIADYLDQIYFQGSDALYVNLFAPSRVKWLHKGRSIEIRQVTRFPEAGTTEFTVTVDQPCDCALKIRNPQWLSAPMSGAVNGQAVPLPVGTLHWATVRREWRSGDRLAITLPMRLAANSFDAPRPYPAAVSYGPVTLAFQAADDRALARLDLHHPAQSLRPVAGQPLTWQLGDDAGVLARPFYSYREGEPYYLYFDPNADEDAGHQRIRFKLRWLGADRFHFSDVVGATAEYTFHGTAIRWLGSKFDDAGRAEVAIDDKPVAVVDQYGPGRNLPFDWSVKNLAPGKHTIRIKILAEKSPQSKGRFINIAGFETPRAGGALSTPIGPAPVHHAGTTHKILQLTGDWDLAADAPTLSRTKSRAGVIGTDLGSSFEHQGRLCFLLGDTKGRPGDATDCLAFSTSTDPEKLTLNFPLAPDGKFLPLKIPGVSQGGMEVPSGGISLGGKIYLVHTTDWHEPTKNMERSMLARSDDDGRTWRRLYNLSAAANHDMTHAKFINVSMAVAPAHEIAETDSGPLEPTVFIWGTGAYRKSNPFLARVPAVRIEDRSAIRYYAGVEADGLSRWSAREADAVPLFDQPQIGELSVAWIAAVQRWVMLYQAKQPRGVTIRTAPRPHGPWSAGQIILEPWKDGAYGKYMHVSWTFHKVPRDRLSDPGREDEWGAEYAPYLIPRFTRGDAQRCRIYYTLSTWNPYQTILVASEIGAAKESPL